MTFPSLRGFCRDLGGPQIIDDDQFTAFDLRGVVALFALAQLARDGNTEPDLGSGGIRRTIGIMVDAPGEVDQLAGQMRNPDARVTKEPIDAEFFTGRSAYLCDPEGNYYEITWPSQITRSHHAAPPEPDRHLARRAFPEASLPTIRLPALLFCAESVEVTPATMSQAHEGIPGSEFVMTSGCSHMSPAERPEATIGMIRGELAGVGAVNRQH